MLSHTTGHFSGWGGVDLYFQKWRQETSRGTVGIVHGVGEHSSRYDNVVQHLASHGFVAYGYDLRGHGRSQGKRIHINHWSEYREDLHAFLELIREQEPKNPLFVYGHSMGALITLDYLVQKPRKLQGAILSGIPLEPAGIAKAHLVAVARMLSVIWPRFSMSLGLNHSALSRDPAVVKAYETDPLISERVSVRWGTESLATIARLKSRPASVVIPVLLIHGGADSLNLPLGARNLFESIPTPDKTLKIYPDRYHEAHNDLNYKEVLNDITQWLEQHLSQGLASALQAGP